MTEESPTSPEPRRSAVLDPDRVRRRGVLGGTAVTVLATVVVLFFDVRAAIGLFLGGAAGTLGFVLLARRLSVAAGLPPSRLAIELYKGILYRLALYGGALVAAYFVDREGLRGLLGGAAGLLLMHAVVLALGISGAWSLRPDRKG